MSDTFFQNGTIIPASWLNDLNKLNYSIFGNPSTIGDIQHDSLGGTGGFSHLQLDQHALNSNLHFDDVPNDGATYSRKDKAWVVGSGGGTTDHSALTNLAADDHAQYHNDTRGDSRYLRKDGSNQMVGTLNSPEGNLLGHVDAVNTVLRTYQEGAIFGANGLSGNISANGGLQVTDVFVLENSGNNSLAMQIASGDLSVQGEIEAIAAVRTAALAVGTVGMSCEGFTLGPTLIFGTVNYDPVFSNAILAKSGFVSSVSATGLTGRYDINLSSPVSSTANVLITGSANNPLATEGGTISYDPANSTVNTLRVEAFTANSGNRSNGVGFSIAIIDTNPNI